MNRDKNIGAKDRNVIKINVKRQDGTTSITLRKDVVALWVVMMDKVQSDPVYLVQDFIHDQCLPRWKKHHGRGLSDFISQCMIRNLMTKEDFYVYRKIQKEL